MASTLKSDVKTTFTFNGEIFGILILFKKSFAIDQYFADTFGSPSFSLIFANFP